MTLKEIFRRLFEYPGKLLATFSPINVGIFIGARLSRRKLISIKVKNISHKVWMRPRSTDVRVAYEIFGLGELSNMRWPFSKPPKTIIDGGANVGFATVAFRDRWPDAFILSVEPDASNFEVLAKNCDNFARIELHREGLWGTRCRLKVRPHLNQSEWSLQFEPAAEDDASAIPAARVNDLIELLPDKACDLLKLDIEGAERDVFGADADLSYLHRTRAILIETHGQDARRLVEKVARDFDYETSQAGEKLLLWRADPTTSAST